MQTKINKTLLLLSLSLACDYSNANEKPNIVIFFVDDMGLMDTSVPFLVNDKGEPCKYPLNNWYKTPNMERMAKQGIRFSTFYTQSVSSPSRASLMTGQNSARHGVTNWLNTKSNNRGKYGPKDWNWDGLNGAMPLLPKILKENGYKTIHIGKPHFARIGSNGEDPLNLGFEVQVGATLVGPRSYLGQENFGYKDTKDRHFLKGMEKYVGKDIFLTEALTQEAIYEVDKSIKENKPFYLYMSHYAVHSPFFADQRFIDNYKNTDKSVSAQKYASMIEGMDKSLGDIMNYLEKKGVADNTIIFFIGDNGSDAPLGDDKGYTSSAPLRGKKGSEYEGGNRVPFIACWGKENKENQWQRKLPIPKNTIQLQMGTIMDIYPTLCSMLDIDIPKGHTLDGQNLQIQLSGKINTQRKEMMMVHYPHEHWGSYFTTYRKGDWKLIYYYNPQLPEHPFCELYNLKKDPYEIHNYASTKTEQLLIMIQEMAKELEKEDAKYPEDINGNPIRPIVIKQ